MKTIYFRTTAIAVTVLAMSGGAGAQDRSAVLTRLDVTRLVAASRPDDHARLRDHFATVADNYSADATRHRAWAQVITGNPNHPPAVSPGTRHTRLAAKAAASAAALRELSAHHGRLAAERASTAPPNAARFEHGAGAPEASDQQVRELVSGARTAADHRALEAYFVARSNELARAADRYAARARGYQSLDSRIGARSAAGHWEQMARVTRESAQQARGAAAEQRQLADRG